MKLYLISNTEWIIMQILWKKPKSTLGEIVSQLDGFGWSQSTIKTLIKRLADKGYIDTDKAVKNNFKYSAAVMENECKLEEARDFLARVFDGSISMLVSTFVNNNKLSEEEQKKLIEIIKKMED